MQMGQPDSLHNSCQCEFSIREYMQIKGYQRRPVLSCLSFVPVLQLGL